MSSARLTSKWRLHNTHVKWSRIESQMTVKHWIPLMSELLQNLYIILAIKSIFQTSFVLLHSFCLSFFISFISPILHKTLMLLCNHLLGSFDLFSSFFWLYENVFLLSGAELEALFLCVPHAGFACHKNRCCTVFAALVLLHSWFLSALFLFHSFYKK